MAPPAKFPALKLLSISAQIFSQPAAPTLASMPRSAMIGQQQVDQHAVVVSGVPDPQLRENIQRALPRGLIPEQRRAVQCAFHDKADLAGMRGLARPDRLLDRS